MRQIKTPKLGGERALRDNLSDYLTTEIKLVADAALQAAEVLLSEWLPDGKRKGREYWPTNPLRGDRSPGSFSINLETGQWHDFASQDRGGDLVSLRAYLQGVRQIDAALMIAERLGMTGLQLLGNAMPLDPVKEAEARQRVRQEAEQRRRDREAEREQNQALAASQAQQWWKDAIPAESGHPYLLSKRVQPQNLRQRGAVLLVPIFANGVLVNLQRIWPDGKKRFLPGGRITGAASMLGSVSGAEKVYLVEGWSTGATVHEATGAPVVIAMNCGNLMPVARALRNNLPAGVAITIAADNDQKTDGNPGLTTAQSVARAISADLTWPRFPCNNCGCSDFNDLAACARRGVAA